MRSAAFSLTALCLAGILAAPVLAKESSPPPVPGGKIGTLALGRYVCEMPGEAGGLASKVMPEYEFKIVNGSSYKSGDQRGSYLYTGKDVVMTSGALDGMKFRRISLGFLREVAGDGSIGPMRCIRTAFKG